ncbi:unnamed protein product [Cunninghamella blakesleeana]
MKNGKSSNNHWQEYKTMKRLSSHPNIVHFYDGFTGPSKRIYFVMEFVNGGNLLQLLKERRENKKSINEIEIRLMLRQILGGLASIHDQGYVHRDLKPENLLVELNQHEPTQLTIKLADFGLARELKSKAPCTDYVSTRWYRAPEVLLKSSIYSTPVDIWAAGAIMAELITLYPLFPGSSEIDQLYRICEILGSPGENIVMVKKKSRIKSSGFTRKKSDLALQINASSNKENVNSDENNSTFIGEGGKWEDGVRLASKLGFKFPQLKPKGLSNALPTASNLMIDIVHRLLMLDPTKRLNAHDALGHPFFIDTENTSIIRPLSHQEPSLNKRLTTITNKRDTDILNTTPISQNGINLPTTTPIINKNNLPNIDLLPCIPSPFLESKFDFNNLSSSSAENLVLVEKPDNSHKLNLAPTTNYDQRQRYSTPNMYSTSFQFESRLNLKDSEIIIPKINIEDEDEDDDEDDYMDKAINKIMDEYNNNSSNNNNCSLGSIVQNHKSVTSFNASTNEINDIISNSTNNYIDFLNSNRFENMNQSLEQQHESLNNNILINVRPSFSTPLNHLDHLQQQQQRQYQKYNHHHRHSRQEPTVKKKQSTGFSQFFGLRKKTQQSTTSSTTAKEQKIKNNHSNKIKFDKNNNKNVNNNNNKYVNKNRNTSSKPLAEDNNSKEPANIPRTESFSSFFKHITSSSSSMKPTLLSKISSSSQQQQQQQQLKEIEHKNSPSYRRSSSMTLLNTYYQDETKKKLHHKVFSKNNKKNQQLHEDIYAYNNPSASSSTSTPLIFS